MENKVVVIKGLEELFRLLESEPEESVDKTVDMHKKSFCIMLPRKKGNDVLIPYAPSGRYWEDDNSPKDPPINSKSPPRRKSKRLQDLERKK